MEISDLATSAGINIGLATIFLILYSIFRNQPENAGVYSTRQMLRDQRKEVKERQPFSIHTLLPSPGWVTRAWNPSEDDIMESAGLDAVVFLRIFKFWWVSEWVSECEIDSFLPYYNSQPLFLLHSSSYLFNWAPCHHIGNYVNNRSDQI